MHSEQLKATGVYAYNRKSVKFQSVVSSMPHTFVQQVHDSDQASVLRALLISSTLTTSVDA